MELIEQVKVLYPDFGTTDTAKMLRVRQTTIKKIVDENNLQKRRRIDIDDFYNIEKKEIAYLLGLLWADGSLSRSDNNVSIECNRADMNYFREILDKVGKWSYYNRQRNDREINAKPITNAYICDSLLHKFLVENEYFEKSLKSPYKVTSKIPSNLIRYFLLGMVDGDGCFYFNKKQSARQFILTGTIYQDWTSFERIFNSLDVKCRFIRFSGKKSGYSQLRITNKKDIQKVGDFIYSTIDDDNIGLKRKYDKYKLIIE